MLRPRITYANVMSTLAVFLALGTGGAYAVDKITGADVRNRSLTSRDLKSNSANGRVVNERSLGAVPRAQNAARLAGLPYTAFLDHCPADTKEVAGTCIERQARPAATYRQAALACSATDNRETAGRRLPTHQELMVALADPEIQLPPEGELFAPGDPPPSATPTVFEVSFITDEFGHTQKTTEAKPYRCAAPQTN
jgi:hypothetical protein